MSSQTNLPTLCSRLVQDIVKYKFYNLFQEGVSYDGLSRVRSMSAIIGNYVFYGSRSQGCQVKFLFRLTVFWLDTYYLLIGCFYSLYCSIFNAVVQFKLCGFKIISFKQFYLVIHWLQWYVLPGRSFFFFFFLNSIF